MLATRALLALALGCTQFAATADQALPPQHLTSAPPAAVAAPPTLDIFAILDREHPQFQAAERFSAQLISGPWFNASLHGQLGRPSRAGPYFVMSKIPDYFEVHPVSSRYQAETMVRLSYPGASTSAAVLETLRRSGRFKSVSVARSSLDFSSTPHIPWQPTVIFNDPLYDEPASGNRPAGNYGFSRMNFEGAWELNQGRALIGALDAGIAAQVDLVAPHSEIIHEDLGEKYATHLSQNTAVAVNWSTPQQYFVYITEELGGADLFPPPGTTPRGHGTHVAALMAADTGNNKGNVGACPSCPLAIARNDAISVFINPLTTGSRTFRAPTGDSLASVVDQGITVLNRSGARPANLSNVDCSTPDNLVQQLCVPFQRAVNRQVLIVASAGNDRAPRLPFPNNITFNPNLTAFDPAVLTVGGHKVGTTSPLIWISPLNCANADGCGSNFGSATNVNDAVTNRLSVLAAAPDLLTAFFPSGVWAAPICQDLQTDFGLGYDYCTGTSMSAPLVSGLAGLLRSANPLITRQSLRNVIEQTASRAQQGTGWFSAEGFGIPDATLATQVVLGRWMEDGKIRQWRNRLTPFIHMQNPLSNAPAAIDCVPIPQDPQNILRTRAASPGTGANLQTTSNQVASSAMENSLYLGAYERTFVCVPPSSWSFTSIGPLAPVVPEFAFADTDGLITNQPELVQIRASMYLFTTGQPVGFYPPSAWSFSANPGPPVNMLPVIRMSFDSPWPAEVAHNQTADVCPGRGRDFAYATNALEFTTFRNMDLCNYTPVPGGPPQANSHNYRFDQVEGFLLAACPSGWSCTGLPAEGGLQPVFLRGRPGQQVGEPGQDWVILLQEQLTQSAWSAYTVKPPKNPDDPLGFAFKNINRDGDLLIDGIELMIGTNPLSSDTDGDGRLDSEEYSPTDATIQYPPPPSISPPQYFGTNPRVFDCYTNCIFKNGFEG